MVVRPFEKEIKTVGMLLDINEQSNSMLCPFCGGGTTKEKSFVITRTPRQNILYICHRASCDERGRIMVGGQIEHVIGNPSTSAPKTAPKFLRKASFSKLPEDVSKFLSEKYFLREEQMLNWLWISDIKRLWLPIRNVHGERIGGVAKTLAKDIKPKNYTVLENPKYPLGDFSINGLESTLWIVEDQISKARVCTYANCLALLGTNLSESLVASIKNKKQIRNLVIALDKDAFAKSLILQKKFNALFDEIKVVELKKDIKDMTDEELEEIV